MRIKSPQLHRTVRALLFFRVAAYALQGVVNMIGRGVLLIGVPASVIGFLISALVFSALDLPAAALPWIAAFPLLLGSYLAGHYAARRRRFHGWQTGMAAGVLLTGLWYTAACLTAGGLCAPTVLPVAAVGRIQTLSSFAIVTAITSPSLISV